MTRWPSDIERDIDDEIAAHLDERADEYRARGCNPERAAAEAARRFGNREAITDLCRRIDRGALSSERRRHMLADLRQDVGYALRSFTRTPGFAAVAIVTLALGMGATTTIFTLANWALLRPVPGVADPEAVSVFWVGRRTGGGSFTPSRLSYPNLADVLPRLKTMSLGAYQGGGPIATAGGGQAARNVGAQYVTAGYFEVLGVRMQLGRPFTAAEDTPPSPFLGAVISDRLWRSMFQRDPNVLQQTLDVAGTRFTILGVAPPGFHGTERLSNTDLWLPGASTPIVRHLPSLRYDVRGSGGYYELVARLKPGATWTQAQAEFESLRAWLRQTYPKENAHFDTRGFHLMGPIGPPPFARDMMKKVVGVTAGGASALVMLIACANVAGLLTIRGIGRRAEIAVRKALGAGRGRLIRQQVAEGLLLWLLGGAAALLILAVLRQTMDAGAMIGVTGLDAAPPIDWRVLAFTAALSLVIGIAFSVGPALRVTRVAAADTLRSAGPTVTRRMFVGTTLAVFQLAASVTLLVGAFLLAGTLRHLTQVPLGFEPDGLFVFAVRPAAAGYTDAQSLEYVDEFRRRMRQAAGVRGVAAALGAPFAGSSTTTRIRRMDADPQARPLTPHTTELFSADYFATVGIPIVKGRTFTDDEIAAGRRGEARSVIVSDALARRLFGDGDPLGRQVAFPVLGREGPHEIVGVAATARYTSLVSEPEDMVYETAGPRSVLRDAVLIVRADGHVRVGDEARRIAADLNRALPLTQVRSMAEAVGRVRQEWDSLARLLGALAAIAALLACVGLYGVVAHGVAQRKREFGIRVALGASRGGVWRVVAARTAAITGAGLALGLVGAYAFAQALSTRLVGVRPFDPVLWSLAALALIAVAVLASVRPALAATRVDVAETLRSL